MGLFSTIAKVAGVGIGFAVGGPAGAVKGYQIGSAVGGVADGEKGFKTAAGQQAQAGSLQQQNVAFSREQLDDWQDLYGDIESNLSDFYSNLDADTLATSGLQNFEREFKDAKIRVDEDFARRGITPESGVAADKAAGLEIARGEERARILTEAPFKTAALQSDFLRLGLPQKGAAQNRVSNSLLNQSQFLSAEAAQTRAAAGAAVQQGSSVIGDVLGNILSDKKDKELEEV